MGYSHKFKPKAVSKKKSAEKTPLGKIIKRNRETEKLADYLKKKGYL